MKLINKILFHTCILVLAALAPTQVLADSKLAFSKPNKVEFVAKGNPWCKAIVQLEIRLQALSSPLVNKNARREFMPRLKPVIEKKCPIATRIQAKVVAPNGRVLQGSGTIEARREDGWTAIEIPPTRNATKSSANSWMPFKSAKKISSTDQILAILNYQSQYKNITKFPGILNSLASVYACDHLRVAQYNEFMQQTLKQDMKERLLSLSRRADEIKAKSFKVSFEITLESYDFDKSGFAHSAFEDTLGIEGIQAQKGCRSNWQGGLPWDFSIKFKGGMDIKFQPVNIEVAEAYVGRMQKNNNGNRTVIVEMVYTIAGITIDAHNGLILADPVAVRFLDPIDKRELSVLDTAGIAKLKVDAEKIIAESKAERLELERKERLEKLRRQQASMLNDYRQYFDSEKRRLQRIAHTMGIHNIGERIYDREFPNPAVAAATARLNGEPESGYVIFKAEGSGKEKIKAAWPAGLTITLKDKASAPLKSEGWYVVYGVLSFDKPGDRLSPILPAILKASWIYACTDTACAEADNDELMLDVVAKRLDESVAKAGGGE